MYYYIINIIKNEKEIVQNKSKYWNLYTGIGFNLVLFQK